MRSLIIVATLFAASCGGGSVVDLANKAADKACACADFDCAKGVVAEFNKASMKADDAIKALATEDKGKYDAAVNRMSECRDKLNK